MHDAPPLTAAGAAALEKTLAERRQLGVEKPIIAGPLFVAACEAEVLELQPFSKEQELCSAAVDDIVDIYGMDAVIRAVKLAAAADGVQL